MHWFLSCTGDYFLFLRRKTEPRAILFCVLSVEWWWEPSSRPFSIGNNMQAPLAVQLQSLFRHTLMLRLLACELLLYTLLPNDSSCRMAQKQIPFSLFTLTLTRKVRQLWVQPSGRSIDRLRFTSCVNRSRVFHYFPIDYWLLAGDSPGCCQGRRDTNTCTFSYTETTYRHAKVGVHQTIGSWFTTVWTWRAHQHTEHCLKYSL